MNISSASTRAFAEYHEFHERINIGLKTSAIGLILLRKNASDPASTLEEIKSICYEDGSLWGGMPGWGSAKGALDAIVSANHDLGSWGVIQSFSAFDVFLETLDAELHAWRAWLEEFEKRGNEGKEKKKVAQAKCATKTEQTEAGVAANSPVEVDGEDDEEDAQGRALRFYVRHNWELGSVRHLIPVYTYFRRLRNCIAHTKSRASKSLVEAAMNPLWKDALKNWPPGDITLPKPQAYIYGESITITYKEALLTSSMLRLLAHDMTQKAMQELGQDGLVHLVVSRLLKYKATTPVGGRDNTGLLHKHLEKVHRVNSMTNKNTRQILEKVDLWKDWNRWHQSVRDEKVRTKAANAVRKALQDSRKHSKKKHPANGNA